MVLFAGVLSLATGILFGLYPAQRITRVRLKGDAGQPASRAAVRRDGP